MREYVLNIIEENSYLFTEESLKLIYNNIDSFVEVYQLALINALRDLKYDK